MHPAKARYGRPVPVLAAVKRRGERERKRLQGDMQMTAGLLK